ncbi:sensor histidine kinase [Agarilytica rhodophyticola]|uniref:sensor histidine kinase n=1 Tax=Agarilytica rhodophyticola TaxID=1737490 RepID=UPI000B349435|nr:HAMP domain-containing sensor histidine kinase [Agarilytica rhodophyticola]
MKPKTTQIKSISQQVRWQLMLLGCALFFASLMLLVIFSFHAIESTTRNLVQLEAESIVKKSLISPDLPLPRTDTQGAYRRWSDIPIVIRHLFNEESNKNAPSNSGQLLEASRISEDGTLEYFYLLHHFDETFGDLFLLSRHDAEEIELITARLFSATLQQSFWSTFIIFTLLFLLIRWLIQRTSEPLALLNRWAADLGKNPDLPLKEDFAIEELNQLALQLREGVDKIASYNQREREFLRYASHELRTPLGIIQASLDTLELQSEGNNKSVKRALKACNNVRQLSSALLWLARESDRPINKSTIEVESLIHRIIDDNRYLLHGRKINIKLNKIIDSLYLEEELLVIVFSNVLRNAFQYSTDGDIEITLSQHELHICNPYADIAENMEKQPLVQSFGIGLELVKRICQKLSWKFKFQKNISSVSVIVRF